MDTRPVWKMGLGSWVLFSLLQGSILRMQESVPFFGAVATSAAYYGLLLLLAIPVWHICRWVAEHRLSYAAQLGLHLVMLLAVMTCWQAPFQSFLYLAAGPEGYWEALRTGGLWILLQALVTYALLVTAVVSLQSVARLEMQRRREAELSALARHAELTAVKAQLRPHFIFNVLNSIYCMIRSSPEEAERMVELVAGLIRETLDVTDQATVPLEFELELVNKYLAIEGLRFGDRLRVETEVAEEVRTWPVPPLLLQPLVENAIKHGVSQSEEGGLIRIEAAPEGDVLGLTIRNQAPPLERDRSEGLGLSITEGRLRAAYGEAAKMRLRRRSPVEVELKLLLPLRPSPSLESAHA